MYRRLAPIVVALALVAAPSVHADSPYAPYAFLIGDWNVSTTEGTPFMVARLSWAANRSYIRYTASILSDKGEEPHFDGVLMWNGVAKNLDMLLMLDLTARAGAQERGTLSIAPDGTVVREIVASYSEGMAPMGGHKADANGATANFRQTYRRLSADRIATTVMRKTAQGWLATFPGSDRLIMTRRPAS